ncbi:MAG: pur operon repressor [Armatimonadota bacterium]|nr:pur operon repressor [Armatimonadota bacterium]MDR7451201.1 pur operon repressor [Armatimonadota bacterium]MDR7467194.1 pur operon repressor [Armatimonadota bacterium]MDR7495207.1 pur operon repressor [Armatimonadota bacterium]MDR7500082.1 pur operon repressor [Armatimonadota bacterium]
MVPRREGGRLRRGERMVIMAHHLLNAPHRLFPLGTFVEMLGAAKSTISEDLGFMRQAFERFQLGKVETLAGAAGGVRYLPSPRRERIRALVEEICQRLRDPSRLLPGGFLYTADLTSTPSYAVRLGEAFAAFFEESRPDVVLTMEVKGIPLALMTARAFDVPLVTIRRGAHPTDGPAVSVNYVSGSSRLVQSMTLPLRAMTQGARVLFIDDFLRGGGTARGVYDLMREFRAEVVGVGVLIETPSPRERMIDRYISLIHFQGVGEQGEILITPSRFVLESAPIR